ncbi:MAG: hypothetical protein H6744_20600 [Deltaproteobacteria bacterium]|nr:hypothetical protein [Deltaproteobacteria bacterium]
MAIAALDLPPSRKRSSLFTTAGQGEGGRDLVHFDLASGKAQRVVWGLDRWTFARNSIPSCSDAEPWVVLWSRGHGETREDLRLFGPLGGERPPLLAPPYAMDVQVQLRLTGRTALASVEIYTGIERPGSSGVSAVVAADTALDGAHAGLVLAIPPTIQREVTLLDQGATALVHAFSTSAERTFASDTAVGALPRTYGLGSLAFYDVAGSLEAGEARTPRFQIVSRVAASAEPCGDCVYALADPDRTDALGFDILEICPSAPTR